VDVFFQKVEPAGVLSGDDAARNAPPRDDALAAHAHHVLRCAAPIAF
jgi:hypothetical protein